MSLKQQFYQDMIAQAEAIMSGESNLIANMANIAAILFNQLEQVNWAGFYLLEQQQLVLPKHWPN